MAPLSTLLALGDAGCRDRAATSKAAGGATATAASKTAAGARPATLSATCPQAPAAVSFDTDTMPTATGTSYHPTTLAELNSDLSAAQYGDEIVLDPSVAFAAGTVTLPKKTTTPGPTDWIVIRSSATGTTGYPAAGQRVRKSQTPLLAHLQASGGNLAIATAADASNYWLEGIEVTATASSTSYFSVVALGTEPGSTSDPGTFAHNIVLDHVYIHGTTVRDSAQASVKHALLLDGSGLALVNSRIGNIHEPQPATCSGAPEAHAVYLGNGTGPYKIDNNYLSSSTENGMLGGGSFSPKPGYIPSDVTITRNHIYKPLDWQGGDTNGTAFLGKTSWEFKAAQRVLFAGNYVENSFDNCSGESISTAMRIDVRNQDGYTDNATINNIAIRNNKFINHNEGIAILGADDLHYSGQMTCVDIGNNLLDHIPGTTPYASSFAAKAGRIFGIENGGEVTDSTTHQTSVGGALDLTIEHNDLINQNGNGVFVHNYQPPSYDLFDGAIFQNNLAAPAPCPHNGVFGCGAFLSADGYGEGDPTIAAYYTTNFALSHNDFVGDTAASYSAHCGGSAGCRFSSSASAVGFTDFANGNYVLAATSADHNAASDGTDIGINDWSATTGVGLADSAVDPEPDDPPGCTVCGDDCVNTTNDPANCGGCNLACAAGQTCSNSTCSGGSGCPTGQTLCGSACVNTASDPSNCGACGNVCLGGTTCSAGSCVCPSGQTLCSGTCVDLQTDANACGSCTTACTAGQSCVSGSCVGSSGQRIVGTDLDGDKKGDLVTRDSSGTFGNWLSNGAVQTLASSTSSYYTDASGFNSGNRFFAMDFDGDGKTDLLARYANGGFDINLSNGSSWTQTGSFSTTLTDAAGWNDANRLFPADINGDGKWDLLARDASGTFTLWLSNGSTLTNSGSFTSYYTDASGFNAGNRFLVLDVDGDGKSDFLARYGNGGFDVNISSGSSYTGTISFSSSYTDTNYAAGLRFFVADINGDGKGDLLVRNPSGSFDSWRSNGSYLTNVGSFSSYFTDAAGFNSGNRIFARDVNGDGRTDLEMRYANGAVEIWSSNGSSYAWYSQYSSGDSDSAGWNSGLRYF